MHILCEKMTLFLQLLVVASLYSFKFALAVDTYYLEERCNTGIDLSSLREESIRIRLTRNAAYARNVNCILAIQPPPGKNLIVKFERVDVQQLSTGQCADALVAIDGRDQVSARLLQGTPAQICGKSAPGTSYVTNQGFLILRFQSGPTNTVSRGFDVLVTAFKQAPCAANEYTCNNQRCINGNLRCSGLDHCGDGTRPCPLTNEAIAGIAVGGVVLIIIIIAAIIFCVCRHKRKTNFSEKAHEHRRNGYEPTVIHGESIKMNGVNGHPVRGVVY